MKVVLFCGGQGMRLRDYSEHIPKPMVPIGDRPILWHLMQYYAFYGHTDFILCLGHKADVIKEYFLTYNETLRHDLSQIPHADTASDVRDWKITFVDSGLHANVGERLRLVESYIGDDELFLANYADGLTDLFLPDAISRFRCQNKIASFVSVRPAQTFHVVTTKEDGLVNSISDVDQSDLWVNGGFFIFKRDIFRYMQPGEELVHKPFQRLIAEQELVTHKHAGFWACMDTFKEKQQLDELYARGNAPWEAWRHYQVLHHMGARAYATPEPIF